MSRIHTILLVIGPYCISALGVATIFVVLESSVDASVAVVAIGAGMVMACFGIALPRVTGPLKLRPQSLEANVESTSTLLQTALIVQRVEAAREAAQRTIPPSDPQREDRVLAEVGRAFTNAFDNRGEIRVPTALIDAALASIARPRRPSDVNWFISSRRSVTGEYGRRPA